jgi:predicted RNA binding protein YcfA (HicA-like mRNA interferase family)
MAKFPSLKSKRMLAILQRSPLKYSVAHMVGSHRKLVSAGGYPDIRYAFHDSVTLPGSIVKEILVNRIGLTEQEALNLL